MRLQVNWDSFVGAYGLQAKNIAFNLARQGMIHCLATNSHDSKKRHAGAALKAVERVAKTIGEKNFSRVVWENPEKVINGQPMESCDLKKIPI